ncbi:MAG: V-type ATP synthase subunit D [Candidatus Omnitrophota bacterium]
MAKIEYNKTFLIQINKDLGVRNSALPILKNKEAALRVETKRIRNRIGEINSRLRQLTDSSSYMQRLYCELPPLVRLEKVEFTKKKIASVNVQVVDKVIFRMESFSVFAYPAWFLQGMEIIKQVMQIKIELMNEERILAAVEYARRKTTQKVNLYEKVQIPFFEETIRKIKRYLEDEENLSKSSQKVIKNRMTLVT